MNISEDTGKLILRLALGVLILLHGVSKVIGGIDPIVGLVVKAGLPASVAYLVYIGEVLAPVMMIIGVWTRAAGVVIAINMVVAVMLAHAHQLFTMSKTGGWALELQGIFFFAALAIALLGAGRLSMGGINGRLN
ncbi:MAG: DoxX family protein [Pyrinomonadaceae bacterium]